MSCFVFGSIETLCSNVARRLPKASEMSIRLILNRNDIAANLQAYGELDVASRILALSDAQYESLSEIGGTLALDGKKLAEAACLAAIKVVEGIDRPLRNKKRNWSLVEPRFQEPDPLLAEVTQWFARYSGGGALSTAELVEFVKTAVAPLVPDFKYLKSKRYFRKKTIYGFQQIAIEPHRTGLSFRFGVRHDAVEVCEDKIRKRKPSKYSKDLPTISKWSYNIGPKNRYWKYHIFPCWPIGGRDGLAIALPEIERIIEEIVLPFLETHAHIDSVRDTFLDESRRADEQAFAQTVFAIDVVTGRSDRLDEDARRMSHMFLNFPESIQYQIVEHLERAKQLSIDVNSLDN